MMTLYSFDTSALIDGLERYYPAETFSGLWEAVDTLISDGRFFASAEVLVKKWADSRQSQVFVGTDAIVTLEVQKILETFPRLVMSGGRRNRADPFVVAIAKLRKATVVTGEGNDGSMNRPKIPFVCQEMKIPCVTFTEFISSEQWKFALTK